MLINMPPLLYLRYLRQDIRMQNDIVRPILDSLTSFDIENYTYFHTRTNFD